LKGTVVGYLGYYINNCLEGLRKTMRNLRRACVLPKIRTDNFSNTSLQRYCYGNPSGYPSSKVTAVSTDEIIEHQTDERILMKCDQQGNGKEAFLKYFGEVSWQLS
jgi:hypothetical protein